MTAARAIAHPAARHRRPRPARRRTPSARAVGALRAAAARLALVAAAAVLAPVAWAHVGDELVASARDTAGPTRTSPAALAYPGCRALRTDHPDGVAAVGAVNAGRKARPVTTRDTPLAVANQALDSDGDGLVCERPRATDGRKKAGRR